MGKRVLHITTVDVTLEEVIVDKMKELRKYGYDIEFMSDIIISETGEKEHLNIIKNSGFIHHAISIADSIKPLKDLKSILYMRRFLKNNPYDIVHTHTAKAGVIGRVAAKLAKIPIVVHTSHGLPFFDGQSKLKNFIYKSLEKFASYFSDGYFSQNKEDMLKIEAFVPKGIVTGYEGNGIDLYKMDNLDRLSTKEIELLKQELGINKDSFIFLMGARFESVKNHHMLLKSLLGTTNHHVKVLLAGKGLLQEEIKKSIKDKDLLDKVIFLGYRQDMLRLIQMSDAIILTSEKEGIPRIVMEAMAFEKPVLATNVLGTKELVVHQQTGELVELNDEHKLAEAIDKWTSKSYRKVLKEYGYNGRKRIEEHFTEEIVAERIHYFYRQINGRKLG